MNDREPNPGQLLAALKREDSPSEADRERVRSRVLASLGAAAVGVSAASLTSKAAAATPKAALALGPVAKLGLVLGLVGGGAVFASKHWDIGARTEPRAVTTLDAREPQTLAASEVAAPEQLPGAAPAQRALVAGEEEPLTPSEAAGASPTTNAKSERAQAGSKNLDAEVSLLRAAQQALQSGRYSEALTKLAEHAQRFPRGLLRNEREASRAIALCQGGQSRSGQSRAREYLRAHADSPLAARVQGACKLE